MTTKLRRRQPMGLAGFLGHKSGGGSGTNRLKKWKDDGEINVWLHTRSAFAALWKHPLPRIVTREDKNTRDSWQEVWPGDWNCLEDEETLKNQYKRKDGERTVPPEVCPMCRFVEEIRRQVTDGELSIVAPVLEFKIDGPKANDRKVGSRTVNAGGIFNAFSENNQKNLTTKQQREVKRAGVSLKEAWKDNMYAKCGYIFVVVNHDDPASGIQVAEETTLLGDLMKEAIRDQMTAEGEDEGNPMTHPYAFKWKYSPNEKVFNKKYKVIPMRKLKLPPAVKELIYNTDPPNIDHMLAPGNVKTLRGRLEELVCKGVEVDWDEIFAPAEALADANGMVGSDPSTEFDPDELDKDDAVQSLRGNLKKGEKAEDEEEAEEDEEDEEEDGTDEEEVEEETETESDEEEDTEEDEEEEEDDSDVVACTKCGEDMGATEVKCPHCGVEYDADGNMIEPEPPKKQSKGKKKGKASKKPVPSRDEQDKAVGKGKKDGFPF